jgi:hypothetical protein
MFDTALPDLETLGDVDDNMLVAAIAGWAQVEAAAAARRLAAIAELVGRRVDGGSAERGRWACDNWDAVAAEVAAAQHISHGMASAQMYLAVALRERLPRVGALFAEGALSARLVSTIAWHTTLINDEEALRLVDAALAEAATTLGPLSATKTADAIDALVDRYDPGALRRIRGTARSREVVIDTAHPEAATTALWGRLYSADATTVDRRLTQMANDVCDDDPRTLAQRRADALGALAAGAEKLACRCGSPKCPAAGVDARAAGVIVHVVAETAALGEHPDPHMSGDGPAPRPVTPDMTLTEALTPEPEPDPPAVHSPAVILGGGMVPAPLLAELIRSGAKVTPLSYPANPSPEAGYRPSAALEAFVRCRDMTCRFPGCDRPATYCDLDHAIAYPLGPTHPSNLRCLCRLFRYRNKRHYADSPIMLISV